MYRLVDCDTWADSWFEGLEPTGKLFFLYLLTNPRSTSAGVFEITPRKMAFETGLAQPDIERWLQEWRPRVQWWPEHSVVWIKNFYRRQGNHNEKTRINAARIVGEMPVDVQRAIGKAYPELCVLADTPEIPDPYPTDQKNSEPEHENKTEPEQETDPETERAPAAAEVRYSPLFEEFWAEWSTGPTKGRGSKKLAYDHWKRWGFDRPTVPRDAVFRGLAAWKASEQWQREGGRYVKHAERWLRDRGWEDDAPARASPNGQHANTRAYQFAQMATED